jgi:hypothetical protein
MYDAAAAFGRATSEAQLAFTRVSWAALADHSHNAELYREAVARSDATYDLLPDVHLTFGARGESAASRDAWRATAASSRCVNRLAPVINLGTTRDEWDDARRRFDRAMRVFSIRRYQFSEGARAEIDQAAG